MRFRVMILKNGEVHKVLYKCKTDRNSRLKFKEYKELSDIVKHPKKVVTSNNITEVNYELCRVKLYEPKDEDRTLRDKFGRLIKAPRIGKWVILNLIPYFIEETFYVFGYNSISDRKDFMFILGLITKAINHEKITKNVILLHNKIIIYNEYQFDLVICKTKDESIRLYNNLKSVVLDNKLKRILFMDHANDRLIGELYEMIMEETGWDYRKVTRTSTNN